MRNPIRALIATVLLCFAIQNHAATLESSNLNSHFKQVNGMRLHYIDQGHGPLIVLLHGWPETSAMWLDTMQGLSKQYHVVAPDLRGLGQSEHTKAGYDKKTIATDIKALITALGEKHAVIIGHDMGGKVAYTMAHLYPDSVSKLVLVDCLIPGTENADAFNGGAWHYGFHMAPNIPEMLTKGHEKSYLRAQIDAMSFNKEAIDDKKLNEYVKYYASEGGMTAGFNYYRALKEDRQLAATFRNKPLTIPVLTISGRHSVAEKLPQALAKEASSIKSVVIENSGHFVPEESPQAFQTTLIEFLDTNDNK